MYGTAVSSVDQRVSGEWFEVRERLRHPTELRDYLCESLSRCGVALSDAARDLDGAVEAGVLEFKRSHLQRWLDAFDEAAYSGDTFEKIDALLHDASVVLLAAVVQRGYLSGELKRLEPAGDEVSAPDAPTGDGSDPSGSESATGDINAIISEVRDIIASDPQAKMNSAIKNILLQVQKYRQETETFKKLRQQASDYRLEMYSRTFATSFKSIFESIRRNYEQYLGEQGGAVDESPAFADPTVAKPWTAVVTKQIEQFSRIRAVLLHVSKETSGMREPLVALGRDRASLVGLIDDELERATEVLGGSAPAHATFRALAREEAERFRRWAGAGR